MTTIIIDVAGAYNDRDDKRQDLDAGAELDAKSWYAKVLVERGRAHYPRKEQADIVDSLPIGSRAADSLRKAGLTSKEVIIMATDDELMALDWIGPSTLEDIRNTQEDREWKEAAPKRKRKESGISVSAGDGALRSAGILR